MIFSIGSTIATALFFLVCIYIYRKSGSRKPFGEVDIKQGCEKCPQNLEPNLLKARTEATRKGKLMELYMAHFDQYGTTWEEGFMGTKIINTMEARNVQQVTALAFHDWGKPSATPSTPFFGKGIFSMTGPEWKHARQLIRPTFSRAELSSDVETMEKHVGRFIATIPRDGRTVDLQPLLHKLFLDSSTEFLLGESIDSQVEGDPNNSTEILEALDASLAGVGKRRLLSRFERFIHGYDKNWRKACKTVHSYLDSHVVRALQVTQISAEKDDACDKEPSQNRYILLHEMAKQIRDPIALRFQILNVFIPARGSPAVMLANAFFNLTRNPQIWMQLRTDSLALGDIHLTFEVLKSLKLFKYVLFESLRLQGPSGRMYRTAMRDTVLPVGGGIDGKSPVFVERGTVVALNLWCLHHDQTVFGQDVYEFNPYRWFNLRRQLQWEFVPFLGGPRICPAQQQVLTQAVYLLVRMTREFESIEKRDPVMEWVGFIKALTESKNGVKVAFKS